MLTGRSVWTTVRFALYIIGDESCRRTGATAGKDQHDSLQKSRHHTVWNALYLIRCEMEMQIARRDANMGLPRDVTNIVPFNAICSELFIISQRTDDNGPDQYSPLYNIGSGHLFVLRSI